MDNETLNELYDALVRDYSRNPRHYGQLKSFCCSQNGHNRSCGDELTIFLKTDGDLIKDLSWEGDGCTIFRSSSSMLAEKIIGLNKKDGEQLVNEFISFIVQNQELNEEHEPLHIFAGVKKFPERVKCALLPWRTMETLLKKEENKV